MRFPLTEETLEEVIARESAALHAITAILEREADDIAAIIIEPIQGEGGDNHLRPEFLRALRQLADDYEVMLIFDEVQTGMGLTGSWWAFQQLGVQPDIFAFGKKTQVCGIAVSRRVDEVERNVFVEPSRISSTFGGNLVDMVRAQRIIEVIVEENLIENARRQGEVLLGQLRELATQAPIDNVRGRGLMIAFDLPTPEDRDAVIARAYEERLLLLPCGTRSIRLRPHLSLTTDEAEALIQRLTAALAAVRPAS